MIEMPISTNDRGRLRDEHYNAEVTYVRHVHDDLLVFRVRSDGGLLEFEPGQYVVLGLGYWERRIEGVQEESISEEKYYRLVKRAYSISCRLVDSQGLVVAPRDDQTLEFYVTLVRRAPKPPALTPRLFRLVPGSRIYLGPRAHGRYTLAEVAPDDQVIFAATGTGEAPHNAMLAQLLKSGHRGPIAALACVRYQKDLGYLAEHQVLQRRFPKYRYCPLTTREPENLDALRSDYVGKRYLQDVFQSNEFASLTGCELMPAHTHVFLCGGPEMIGVPSRTHDSEQRYPKPLGMVEVLERRGFKIDQPHRSGNIHFESYW